MGIQRGAGVSGADFDTSFVSRRSAGFASRHVLTPVGGLSIGDPCAGRMAGIVFVGIVLCSAP
ncbi:hypothetical protein ASG52_03720 [Methylobacterium sp. Leaf456]|nr:hypothetical protein ASG52_03720 [Methylobacterium sp. Leaf456]